MPTVTAPILLETRRLSEDVSIFPGYIPVPELGILPVNAFLLKGRAPMLVDTGVAAFGDDFMTALSNEIDLADLRWIWVSHTDADHVGNLQGVLDSAPNAEVITTFLGMGKMMMLGLPVDRLHLIENDAPATFGDREILPIRPPYYDAPETLGFFDRTSRALFVADCFGAVLEEPAEETSAIADSQLAQGLVTWSAIDAPWLGHVDDQWLERTLRAVHCLQPELMISGHLPPARGDLGRITEAVLSAYGKGLPASSGQFSLEDALQRVA